MNLIFDQAKRKNLYDRIMNSHQYANATDAKNTGILRVHSKLSYKNSWNDYFLPMLCNDFTVEDIKDRDLICHLIKEVDKIFQIRSLHINSTFFTDSVTEKTIENYYHWRNEKQEKRLTNQLIRYFKRLRKNLQRQLNKI